MSGQIAVTDTSGIEEMASSFVIARKDGAQWSAEQQAALDAWLAQSPLHRVAYLRLDAAWSRADRVRALRPTPPKPAGENRWRNVSVRVAAGLVLLAAVGFGVQQLAPTPVVSTYETPVGGHETLRLADGSEIELNTDTKLRTAVTADHRVVWLDKGEAYFRIAHDPAHPFVVNAGQRSVTVLGTRFTVRRDSHVLEVALIEGHIRFDAKDEPAHMPIDLVPGDTVTATRNAVTLAHVSKAALDTSLSWRRGVLVFDRTPLSEAVRELNRYNTEKIVIGDAQTAATTIGGTFEATNVAGFVRVAHAVLGLRVQYRPGETVLSQ
jgi:transmembrane sensor